MEKYGKSFQNYPFLIKYHCQIFPFCDMLGADLEFIHLYGTVTVMYFAFTAGDKMQVFLTVTDIKLIVLCQTCHVGPLVVCIAAKHLIIMQSWQSSHLFKLYFAVHLTIVSLYDHDDQVICLDST